MTCEVCGEREATVHLTQVINESVKKLHLCEECAAASGIDVNSPAAISDVLLGMGLKKDAAPEAGNKSCPHCHMRCADFKKTSRLGCPACYETFSEELDPLLEAMHRGKQHIGKVPSKGASRSGQPAGAPPLVALKQALQAAIKAEHYEEAARLRDCIQQETEKAKSASPGLEGG